MLNVQFLRSLGVGVLMILMVAGLGIPAQAQDDYYKVRPIFIPFPQPGKSWPMRYGPVGLSLDLINPAFTMRISRVWPDSPAAATGKLKKGQIIESINGQTLRDIDPRVQLANILAEAEATDGVMRLKIKGEGDVVVKLPVLGRYSETWPVDCQKSDQIVRNLADLIAKQDKPGWGSVLFLLSTGEDKDLEVVRQWMKDFEGVGHYPWHNGMMGPGVCEYYLRTGDPRMLPIIKAMTEELKAQFYQGGWSGRGKASFTYVGGGHLNAAGVPSLLFLLLARQCGVEVDEAMLQGALRHMFRFAGRGNVAYGDHMPEGGYRDNGKTAVLALAMQAAAQLSPEGEESIYAAARDNAAMKSFYATSWFNRAHTGGGIGEMWHANAMQLMRETKPTQWRSFMDERRWHFDLSRRPNGAIGIEDGARYDKAASEHSRSWGTIHALIYTAHRKNLRLFGAPPTKWSKTHPLPERPWGTAADDVFQSLEPGEYAPGKRQDISGETIVTDASAAWMRRMGSPDTPPETLWIALHHPEYGFRVAAMRYITKRGLTDLVLRALKSDDPRVREVGVEAIAGLFKGKTLSGAQITPEMWSLVGNMLQDPHESLFIRIQAMHALAKADKSYVEPHVDVLVEMINHPDWWVHSAAIRASAKLAGDPNHYRNILPAVANVIQKEYAFNSTTQAKHVIDAVKRSSPAIQKFAAEAFGEAYMNMPETIIAPGGQITPNQTQVLHDRALSFLNALPDGRMISLRVPKLTSQWQATRRDSDKYVFKGRFLGNPQLEGTSWKLVGQTGSIDSFSPDKASKINKPPYRKLDFKADGKTDNGSRMWSGDKLIDLNNNQALQMTVKTLPLTAQQQKNLKVKTNRLPYLFVERGGFTDTRPQDWKSGYFVLQKTK